ncbi:lipocalin-like domain-containing protein [Formosa sp. S-31]|uniref:lipocalin-like domain-containing protein n=1 Tax=Formosa sp. S-31 TaxID=2790949 RepID=UPI003EC01EB5
MKINLTTLILACFVFNFTFAQDWKSYPYTPEGSVVSFPQDEGHHANEPVEWWYTTGEIKGETSGKTFTYMLTYFSYAYQGFDGFRILNITDQSTGTFYRDTKALNYETLSTSDLNIVANVFTGSKESWTTKIDSEDNKIPFEYTISATAPACTLNLDYKTTKRPLLLGDTGYLNQGSENYSYYYSQTGNTVSGSITFNGTTENITGTAWIDRQYGSFNPYIGEKYEWFSIQLSNGMDINAYNIFTPEFEIPDNLNYKVFSAYVDEATQYTTADFILERLEFDWTNDNVNCYSSKWRLTSEKNKVDLTITRRNNTTEVMLPFRFYEGATTIVGTVNGVEVTGHGFAELVHTYSHPELSFSEFEANVFNAANPISWTLNNPDAGSPMYYDLLYSTDGTTFNSLVSDVSDLSYTWSAPELDNGDTAWFKVIAHSIDDVLISETITEALTFQTLSVESSVLNDISLFPNPVKSSLYLKLPKGVSLVNYKIIDISGRLVSHVNVLGSETLLTINTKNLKSGFYYLLCESISTQKSFKFIKE